MLGYPTNNARKEGIESALKEWAWAGPSCHTNISCYCRFSVPATAQEYFTQQSFNWHCSLKVLIKSEWIFIVMLLFCCHITNIWRKKKTVKNLHCLFLNYFLSVWPNWLPLFIYWAKLMIPLSPLSKLFRPTALRKRGKIVSGVVLYLLYSPFTPRTTLM